MAAKDDRLGFDPLAWMDEEENEQIINDNIKKDRKFTNVSERDADADTKSVLKDVLHESQQGSSKTTHEKKIMVRKAVKKTPVVRKTATKKAVTKKAVTKKATSTAKVVSARATKPKSENMDLKQILQNSLDLLLPVEEQLTEKFYDRLFQNYPEVKPLFNNVDWSIQGKKLMASVKLVVKNVDNPEVLENALSNMGKKHQDYGVLPEHYPMVAESLLAVMEELAGEAWTKELNDAWTDAITLVAEKMIAAYESEDNTMVAQTAAGNDEFVRLQGITDAMTAAVMMVNLDLEIVYMNPAADKLMHEVEAELKNTLPNFNADKLIGFCIDDFHKEPSHQRRLLSNPSNLPWKSIITVGPLKFGLNVNAAYNDKGEFIGAVQEWTNETDNVKNAREASSMKAALDGSLTATMICDEHLNITYMNESVTSLLKNRENELKEVLPGFRVDKLIGTSIDQFHKNPAHQQSLLRDPARLPYQAKIQVLNMHFSLNTIMLVDDKGNYAGNSVEWRDITDEKHAEEEIRILIESATKGVLDERLDANKYEGFLHTLGEGMNRMLDTIVSPIKEVVNVANALKNGDLTIKMEGNYGGTFDDLKQSMNGSLDNLLNLVGEIRTASVQIGSAAGEISQGNTDLSQRTEEQASSLEETASSMEELTSTVRQNADNSKQANTLAAGARREAEAGGDVIEQTIQAMTSINKASNKIEDIISVIDEIAFQTNLLALNAAVEAARAGEQGRGFAVVASEVRSLAQRSAAAAKEIKVLIKDSVEKVDEGGRLVNESGKTLAGIVNSVKKVSDIIAEIAAASSEQSAGIDQVGKAITQLDEVTQQNAALVEEAAAASESMDEQAKSLAEQMNFFNTGDMDIAPASVSKPRPAVAAPVRAAQRHAPEPSKPAVSSKPASADEWEEF
ncbi:MAG: PAS domain-containing protein [Gammaproteobacteria bacterium]|nr:PAS domain-containing protein [Gammaproteobacteria bacterium]